MDTGGTGEATLAENLRNSGSRKGTSRYKGVCWDAARGKWVAQIRANGPKLNLGGFANEGDAARAYDEAARRLHGEFARVNFPREGEAAALKVVA